MKKIIIVFLLCFLSMSCMAQGKFQQKDLTYTSFYELFNRLENDPSSGEDILVSLLFSLPVEYHQYVMPMVADMPSISEKTRMMPGIVEWRRKLPTDIAPELANYAKKHLPYLSAIHYPLLMPESWPSYNENQEGDEHHHWPQYLDISTDEKKEQAFPSVIEKKGAFRVLMSPRKDLRNHSSQGDLTERDIRSVTNIMSKFRKLELGSEGEKRRNELLFDLKDQDVVLDALVNPCQSLTTRFSRIDTDGWLDLQLQKENMSKSEFVNKCDRIIKAYRLRQASASKINEIERLVYEAEKLPKDSFYQRIYLTLVRMYLTNREDVRSLNGFEELLKNTFKTQTMIMSTPVVLDF